MKKQQIQHTHWMMLFVLMAFNFSCFSQSTKATKKRREPRHFFNTTGIMDYYNKPEVDLNLKDSNKVSKHLKSYGITQTCLNFYAPVATANWYNKDSSVNSNFHLLLAGTAYYLQPKFKGISQHTLAKYGFGLRMIYNTGKRSIFFVESTPFITQDITKGAQSEATYRMAGTLLWSYSPSKHFNLRLGATKSFLYGNKFWLPFVGLRFGQIDKFNFSVQFPRNASINIPFSQVVRMSIYTKPQGGLFNFSNNDTIYKINNDKTINFGRYELLTGARLDVVPTKWFNFYVATGFSTRNYVAFYSNTHNKNNKNALGEFYSNNPRGTIFLNLGLVFRIGRTKSYLNNQNIYEAIDINGTIDPGENNVNPGNGNIVIPNKRKGSNSLKPTEVQDLIDIYDF
ncbi:MAG: hypothetical protein J0L69_06885 [Bacteroidetes bacterium]|nr:hypothetical protein [Bacteroidota bacterium]